MSKFSFTQEDLDLVTEFCANMYRNEHDKIVFETWNEKDDVININDCYYLYHNKNYNNSIEVYEINVKYTFDSPPEPIERCIKADCYNLKQALNCFAHDKLDQQIEVFFENKDYEKMEKEEELFLKSHPDSL